MYMSRIHIYVEVHAVVCADLAGSLTGNLKTVTEVRFQARRAKFSPGNMGSFCIYIGIMWSVQGNLSIFISASNLRTTPD